MCCPDSLLDDWWLLTLNGCRLWYWYRYWTDTVEILCLPICRICFLCVWGVRRRQQRKQKRLLKFWFVAWFWRVNMGRWCWTGLRWFKTTVSCHSEPKVLGHSSRLWWALRAWGHQTAWVEFTSVCKVLKHGHTAVHITMRCKLWCKLRCKSLQYKMHENTNSSNFNVAKIWRALKSEELLWTAIRSWAEVRAYEAWFVEDHESWCRQNFRKL